MQIFHDKFIGVLFTRNLFSIDVGKFTMTPHPYFIDSKHLERNNNIQG